MRKAMTPLISSVLLIIFAIGLGVIVMSWGKAEQATIAPAKCEQASLSVTTLENKEQVCYTEDSIEFTIENNGEADINSVKITVLGNEVDSVISKLPIKVADMAISSVSYDKAKVGSIKKIRFTPGIAGEKEALCPSKGAELENIIPCE